MADIKRAAGPIALLSASLIAVGAIAANAANDNSTTTMPAQSGYSQSAPSGAQANQGGAQANQGGGQANQGGPQGRQNLDPSKPVRSDEKLLTGDTAQKVKAAALAKYPGATIERVETDSEGVYEAHIVTSDGSHVIVQVDANFVVTGTQTGPSGMGGQDVGGMRGGQQGAPSGQQGAPSGQQGAPSGQQGAPSGQQGAVSPSTNA